MLTQNAAGHYRFLAGSDPHSGGVVADEGWQVVHATLQADVKWRDGFGCIEAHLNSTGLPVQALCGIELRCPAPYTIEGFASYNAEYHALLRGKSLLVEGKNPIARTNVASMLCPAREQSLHAFSYVAPAEGRQQRTFVVSGAGELRSEAVTADGIVRRGEHSRSALLEKAACVVDAMKRRLDGLGCAWEHVRRVNVYTDHHGQACLEEVVHPGIPATGRIGVRLHAARPPVMDILFEMDLQGVGHEIRL